jgi:hypothetical protein
MRGIHALTQCWEPVAGGAFAAARRTAATDHNLRHFLEIATPTEHLLANIVAGLHSGEQAR